MITGISSGLGLYLAKEFLSNGDEVWGIGRREFDFEKIGVGAKEQFSYFQCDTTDSQQVKETFDKMVRLEYIPDIVIFSAGSATDDISEKSFDLKNFRSNFNVNLFGILYWVELFLPHFQKKGKGVFAAISSMSSYLENHKERIGYSASRTALNKTFENLYLEYLDTGIRFLIFNMGRIQEKSDFIGVTYIQAASSMKKILLSGRFPYKIDIPLIQSLLTKAATFIPKKIFKNKFMH